MYHTRSSSIVDKENKEAASSRVLTRQQSSSNLLLPRTPSKQHTQGQQHQQPLKAGIPGTPHLAKTAAIAPSTPTGHSILRAKTNQQLPATPNAHGTKSNSNNTTTTKKSTLARTFSAATATTAAEENTDDYQQQQSLQSPDIAAIAAADARRKSITRRGSNIRERLIVHRDGPSADTPDATAANMAATPLQATSSSAVSTSSSPSSGRASLRKKSLIRRETVAEQARENATTTLAMERSQESLDKVVVGEGRTESKRRALSKEDDDVEVEYCPPRQQEQPYECEVQIDKKVFDLHPPALAYYISTVEDFDLPTPSFEPAETRRRPGLAAMGEPTIDAASTDTNHKEEPDNDDNPSNNVKEKDIVDSARRDEESELEATLHPAGSPTTNFGITDLHDNSRTLPPFDGFQFDVDDSGDDLNVMTETRPGTLLAPSRPGPTQAIGKRTVKATIQSAKLNVAPKVRKEKIASKSVASSTKAPFGSAPERSLRRVPSVKAPPSTASITSASTTTVASVPALTVSSPASSPHVTTTASTSSTAVDKGLLKDIGLEDLEDTSKVESSFTDFQFDL